MSATNIVLYLYTNPRIYIPHHHYWMISLRFAALIDAQPVNPEMRPFSLTLHLAEIVEKIDSYGEWYSIDCDEPLFARRAPSVGQCSI